MIINVFAVLVALHLVSCEGQEDDRLRDKMSLWKRGLIFDDSIDDTLLSFHAGIARRLAPINKARAGCSEEYGCGADFYFGNDIRGGASVASVEEKISELVKVYGAEFSNAIEQNRRDHEEDCRKSCESFYCARNNTDEEAFLNLNGTDSMEFISFPFGSVPPEDFAQDFGFPLDLIKVSSRALFSAQEASEVVQIAESEGLSSNEYLSGKYKLGGDWLLNLPQTRAWFNERLKDTLFPLLSNLFPEIVSSPSVLRAHSVSLLKYNSSHPRTDVHIDNGILAMTLAMTPKAEYSGGGTYFEHLGERFVLPMDVGYGTFRPGSVRHGGHKVTGGSRYILGAFLLIEDRVEHVRRMKNRGADKRKSGDLEGAIQHFEWALAINPKCTTCLKDLGEVYLAKKDYSRAENYMRTALDLLDGKDSDALFTLGIILSEQGKDAESIDAYRQSISINADDAELCYNLGVKLGAKGDAIAERELYEKAVSIQPSMGRAWINWGISLAEVGNLDLAEEKFLKCIEYAPKFVPDAMLNLSLVYQSKHNQVMGQGLVQEGRENALKASDWLENAKQWMDSSAAQILSKEELEKQRNSYNPLRLQAYKNSGRAMAAMRDFEACEKEFRKAVEEFPNDPSAWDLLQRILQLVGKTEEAAEAKSKMTMLSSISGFM